MAQGLDPEGLLEPVEQTQVQQDPEGLLEPKAQELRPKQRQAAQDPEGLLEQAQEKPSRLGAVARTLAEEFIPSTAAGLATGAISRLPVPAVPKFLLGATGGILSYGMAGKLQEEAAKKIAGEQAVEQFKAQRERDIAAYPASTFAASVLTPTAGAVIGVGRKGISSAGQAIRGAFTKAETAAPQAVETVTPNVAERATEAIPVQQELPLGGTKTIGEIQAERSKLIPEPGKGQKVSQFAERVITDPKTQDAVAKKIADERSLYNTMSPTKIADDVRSLRKEQRIAVAQADDNVGNVAKAIMMEDARIAGDIQTADMMFENLVKKFTGAGQLLNIAKLIKTTPDGYAYILEKTLQQSARQFATKEEKDLAKAGKQFTPELRQKAIDLFKNFQSSEKAKEDAFALARSDLSKATKKTAEEAEARLWNSAGELAKFEADLVPKEIIGQQIPDFIRGNLLTSVSQGANILGNTVNMPTRASTRQVASLLDQIERNIVRPVVSKVPIVGKPFAEKYLAKEKQFMSPLGKGSLERFIEVYKAGGRGVGKGVRGLWAGSLPDGWAAGEGVKGFRPYEAAKKLITGKGLAQPMAEGIEATGAKAMDKVRLLSEATLGVAPETMFRLLQLGDAPAREMALARRLTEVKQLEGLSGEALRRAVRFPTQSEVSKVAQEVAEAVYQQDSALSRGINYLLNLAPNALEKVPGIGKPMAGVARTGVTAVIPYSKTPLNVIDEILEYSIPEYSFIKGLKNQATGNFRRAKLQFAKSIVGYSIRNVADIISNAGLITDKPSKSEKVRDIQYQGEPPKMINISGLQRYLDSGFEPQEMQPGDYLMGLEKLGVVGSIMSTSNEARKAKNGGESSVGDTWGETLPATLSFGFNQSFLRNMNSLLGAISRGEREDIDGWLTNYYGALTAAAIPNQLSAFSRYSSENMPDKIRAKDIEGSTFAEKTYNTFKEILKRKFPQDSGDIASRINVWGEPVPSTPEGVDPLIYNFIDPTKGRKVTYDDVTLAVYDLYKKTEKTESIPQVPNRNLDIINSRTGKKTRYALDPDLYEQYATIVGRANRKVAQDLLYNKSFRKLDPEEQVSKLSNAYDRASKEARINFIRKNQRRIQAGREL